MLKMDKENHSNIFFTASYKSLDLAMSFNGTKEGISLVTFYLSSMPLIKMAGWAVSVASVLSSVTKA